MKVGDYVAKFVNPWLGGGRGLSSLVPAGIIVSKGAMKWSWEVLEPSGRIVPYRETDLKVIKKLQQLKVRAKNEMR